VEPVPLAVTPAQTGRSRLTTSGVFWVDRPLHKGQEATAATRRSAQSGHGRLKVELDSVGSRGRAQAARPGARVPGA
jgi:hypothetical protein